MAASEGLAAAAAGNDEGPSMHEMEGPRRVLLPCGRRSLGVRRPCRTCSACSVLAIARLTRSWNGLLVAVCRSRSLGSSSYAELAPRGPPVPIAQVQLLRRAVAPPTWPRSLGTRQRGTASPRPASIARDSSSRDQLRRPTGRLLACPHLGTHHLCRKPAANCGLPLPAAPRESPPGPVPVPGDKEISSGRSPCPTRAFRQHFPRVSASTGQSTAGGRLSPGNLLLSTASSTGTSTASLPTVHHLDTITPPHKRTGYRRTGRIASRSTSRKAAGIRTVAHPEVDRLPGPKWGSQPVHFAHSAAQRRSTGRSGTRHADHPVCRRPLCADR